MQVEKLQDDIVASHGVGDAQDAQDDAVRALASGRNFFFCDDIGRFYGARKSVFPVGKVRRMICDCGSHVHTGRAPLRPELAIDAEGRCNRGRGDEGG